MESVRIVLAGKPYDLSVDSSEVEALRKAADAVNAQTDSFRDRFGVTDRADQLAMAALQLASEAAPAADLAEDSPAAGVHWTPELEATLDALLGRLDRLARG
jgi:cell division protein ZapA (FtsZ GTPase activity inhibitor)